MKIQLSPKQCWVATQPVDFRKAIDGLCQVIIEALGSQPTEGLFIFYSRDRKKIKCIGWHRNGFVMLYKRFCKGRLTYQLTQDKQRIAIDQHQLSWLLAGLDWQAMSSCNELAFDSYF